MDRSIRQQIYYLPIAPAFESDIQINKKRFLNLQDVFQLPHRAWTDSTKKWARKLSQVHETISSELPYVLDNIKKDIQTEFAKDTAAAREHYGYDFENSEDDVIEPTTVTLWDIW